MLSFKVGDLVRPYVHVAGMEPTKLYRVEHLEVGVGLSLVVIAYLSDPNGAQLPPVLNAHLVLEVVRSHTTRPSPADLN